MSSLTPDWAPSLQCSRGSNMDIRELTATIDPLVKKDGGSYMLVLIHADGNSDVSSNLSEYGVNELIRHLADTGVSYADKPRK